MGQPRDVIMEGHSIAKDLEHYGIFSRYYGIFHRKLRQIAPPNDVLITQTRDGSYEHGRCVSSTAPRTPSPTTDLWRPSDYRPDQQTLSTGSGNHQSDTFDGRSATLPQSLVGDAGTCNSHGGQHVGELASANSFSFIVDPFSVRPTCASHPKPRGIIIVHSGREASRSRGAQLLTTGRSP